MIASSSPSIRSDTAAQPRESISPITTRWRFQTITGLQTNRRSNDAKSADPIARTGPRK
jgi:hypothetical protein